MAKKTLFIIALCASALSFAVDYYVSPLAGVLTVFVCLIISMTFVEKLHINKLYVTLPAFVFALILYLSGSPIGPAAPHVLLYHAADKIHLGLFVFLMGLFLYVNTINYSGIINDLSWRIAKVAKGKLNKMMIMIILLTSVCSGVFDGATVASIMGMVTMTILLNGEMDKKRIFSFMLLIVIGTNIGGVWFVLGEPTNILAARNLDLSPMFFIKFLTPFAILSIIVSIFYLRRICGPDDRLDTNQPDLEVLLEGLSLRRIHAGQHTLTDTLNKIGKIEISKLREVEQNIAKGMSDFEAIFQAGVPKHLVYETLEVNLNSEEMAQGLIEYWHAKNDKDPMANLIVGDLLRYVRREYKQRQSSRFFVIAGMVVLVSFLMLHSVFHQIPSFIAPFLASGLALIGLKKATRSHIFKSTLEDTKEILFLAPIFAVISLFEGLGGFEMAQEWLLHLSWPEEVTAALIMAFSSSVSAFADNIAVMDFISRGIENHPSINLYAVSVIFGTALGGFCSPIASVQAIILSTIIARVEKQTFIGWIKKIAWLYLIILALGIVLLIGFNRLGLFS